jgi:hypothetical protein
MSAESTTEPSAAEVAMAGVSGILMKDKIPASKDTFALVECIYCHSHVPSNSSHVSECPKRALEEAAKKVREQAAEIASSRLPPPSVSEVTAVAAVETAAVAAAPTPVLPSPSDEQIAASLAGNSDGGGGGGIDGNDGETVIAFSNGAVGVHTQWPQTSDYLGNGNEQPFPVEAVQTLTTAHEVMVFVAAVIFVSCAIGVTNSNSTFDVGFVSWPGGIGTVPQVDTITTFQMASCALAISVMYFAYATLCLASSHVKVLKHSLIGAVRLAKITSHGYSGLDMVIDALLFCVAIPLLAVICSERDAGRLFGVGVLAFTWQIMRYWAYHSCSITQMSLTSADHEQIARRKRMHFAMGVLLLSGLLKFCAYLVLIFKQQSDALYQSKATVALILVVFGEVAQQVLSIHWVLQAGGVRPRSVSAMGLYLTERVFSCFLLACIVIVAAFY